MERLAATRAILFGVGGVGSWCAEALVRSGIGHLTIVDSDVICITNANRQLQATSGNVGKVKVDELRMRLLEINPLADVAARQEIYSPDTRDNFALESYDYILDAIDSLSCKVDLLITAMATGKTAFSSMGAACKLDPTRIRTASIWETKGCGLAREVRKRLRRREVEGDFQCVYSDELVPNLGAAKSACGTGECLCPKNTNEATGEANDIWCSTKAQINGSLAHITGSFGFALAGLVVQDVHAKAQE